MHYHYFVSQGSNRQRRLGGEICSLSMIWRLIHIVMIDKTAWLLYPDRISCHPPSSVEAVKDWWQRMQGIWEAPTFSPWKVNSIEWKKAFPILFFLPLLCWCSEKSCWCWFFAFELWRHFFVKLPILASAIDQLLIWSLNSNLQNCSLFMLGGRINQSYQPRSIRDLMMQLPR